MKRIGPHVHTTGGVQNAPQNAKSIGATAFGLFTKNQRRWVAKPLDPATIDAFLKNVTENGYSHRNILAHAGYLINIGHPDPQNRQQSLDALIDELQRCNLLELPNLNIHPGSHKNLITEDQCIALIAESINRALDRVDNVSIVIENTAGQGGSIGYRFEHIAQIIDLVEDKTRIGFCLDTCHAFAAGYDLRSRSAYESVMNTMDTILGLSYLRGMHLNDSKSALGSRVDRHQNIGKGLLGEDTFGYIMNDPHLEELPLILETIDETLWPGEISLLYSLVRA